MKNPTVYFVHCIDTEGPLHESLSATFERLEEMFGINIEATKENLYKLQNDQIKISNSKISTSDIFSEDLLNYNDTWDKIDDMLSESLSNEYRNLLKDSFGGGWIYNWFCMDHVGFEDNPRRRDLGINNIYDHYVDTLRQHNSHQDGVYFHYHPIPVTNQDILIWGYFQSDKYFEGCDEEVRNLFTFPEDIVKRIDERLGKIDKHLVGVHVRRGDYLRFPTIHPTQTVEYYKQAFSKFDDCCFIVASDDIPWCEKNLDGDNVIFSNCTSELEDMYLLSQCNSSIVSNGSFAWWGSFLGKEKAKVIAPEVWFGPDGYQDHHDIYCEHWEKLDGVPRPHRHNAA